MAATLTMGSRTTLSLEVLLFGGLTDYRLSIRGRNAVTFDVHVADEVWTVSFLTDGDVRVEIFKSGYNNDDGDRLEELFARHGRH